MLIDLTYCHTNLLIQIIFIFSTSPTPVPSSTTSPSTTFIISTVAGTGTATYSGDNGAATAAGLNLPISLTFDAAGDSYLLLC